MDEDGMPEEESNPISDPRLLAFPSGTSADAFLLGRVHEEGLNRSISLSRIFIPSPVSLLPSLDGFLPEARRDLIASRNACPTFSLASLSPT
jgi:hypothetical protein